MAGGHRIALQRSWQKQGVFEEAEAFRRNVTQELAGGSKPTREMRDRAWEEAERNWPILTAEQLAEVDRVAEELVEPEVEEAKEPEKPKDPAARARALHALKFVGGLRLPESWPKLPATAPYRDEIQWVHSNLEMVRIRNHKGGFDNADLEKALSPPPSTGALTALMGAIRDPKTFNNMLAPKILGGVDESEAGQDRGERKRQGEIQSVLDQLVERDG
jgi:hypothetical protein